MIVLQFVGRDADSDALLFLDEGGNEYTAALSDALVAAVLRGSTLEVVEERPQKPLSPREIQAMLREGMSAEQVAQQTGTDLERVRRFEGPVRAEIAHAIDLARQSVVGSDRDAPTVGDLVVDRLAERGVDIETLDWHAGKRGGSSWEVVAVFVEDGVERSATWTLGESTGLAVAADDAARELTESARAPEPVRALFPPVVAGNVETIEVEDDALLDRQEQLLRRLNAARGRRQPVMMGFEGGQEEPDTVPLTVRKRNLQPEERTRPAVVDSSESVNEEAEPVEEATDRETVVEKKKVEAKVEVEVEEVVEATSVSESSKKRRRTPVPSWDEIVFGSRGD